MRNNAPRAGGQGRLTCVGCGAPVGHNSLKYTREMCLRCYARMLSGQPVGGRDAGKNARPTPAGDKEPRG